MLGINEHNQKRLGEFSPSLIPIETEYKNYLFRSRTEARWAVFFDELSIEYDYELQGFQLGPTRYLPDFWLPKSEIWIEIKGAFPTFYEREKCRRLSLASKNDVLIFYGRLCAKEHGVLWINPNRKYSKSDLFTFRLSTGISTDGQNTNCLIIYSPIFGKFRIHDLMHKKDIFSAFRAAKQARFEKYHDR